jgi:OmpA family
MNLRGAIVLSLSTALLGATGCGRPPRPAALAEAEQVRGAPAVKDAASFAPQVLAHAESLRQQANQAYEQDDIASASMLAERSVVAYERAAVLARIAKADLNAAEADKALEDAAREQRELDAEKQRLEADIASIEQLIQVVKDAQPLTPSPAGDHSREMARLKAARSIIVDAHLLCSSAKLLGKPVQGLDEAQAEVLRLEELLAKWPKPAPIDETLRARARCLSFLTLARRAGDSSTPADLVLSELSNQPDIEPIRDDRGVVVVIRGDIQRDASAKKRLDAVASAAAKFSTYPVLVVSHTRAKPSRATEDTARTRARAVVDALETAGIDKKRIEAVHAGPHRPIAHDPLPPPTNSRNDRIEVVLVAPTF